MKTIFRIILVVSLLLSCRTAGAVSVKETFEEATDAFSKGEYDKAINLYEKILETVPNFAAAYNYLGMVHKAKGTNYKDVLWLFETAVEVDPSYAPAYENLGKTYYALNDFDKAEEYCLKAVELNPQLMNAQLALGWIYLLGKSEPKKAISYFKVVADQRKAVYAYYGLGLAYFMNGDRISVLEPITGLRSVGKEDLALELESMVRSKSYVPTTAPGTSLPIPQKEQGTLVVDSTPVSEEEKGQKLAELKVYLRGKMPGAEPDYEANNAAQQSGPSDIEKLKALKRKTSRNPSAVY